MARRTTADLVKDIMNIPDTLDIEAFIDTASLMTDDVEAGGESNDQKLEMIERWLTAHLVAATVRPQQKRKRIDVAEEEWHIPATGKVEPGGLDTTPWGRQALGLDTTGVLDETYNSTNTVSSWWVGTESEN